MGPAVRFSPRYGTIMKLPTNPDAPAHGSLRRPTFGSKSKRTALAYRSDWKNFTTWCETNNKEPIPATVETVSLYVAWAANQHQASTIRRRLVAISGAHRIAGLPNPTRDPEIRELLKTITQTIGHNTTAHQTKSLNAADITAIIAQINGNNLSSVRDRALISIGFAGMLRQADLIALTVQNLEWIEPEPEVVLHLPTPNTIHKTHSVTVHIESGTGFYPPSLLRNWLEIAAISEGPIFVGIGKGNRIKEKPLTGRSINRILKSRAEAADINPAFINSHSLRRNTPATTTRKRPS